MRCTHRIIIITKNKTSAFPRSKQTFPKTHTHTSLTQYIHRQERETSYLPKSARAKGGHRRAHRALLTASTLSPIIFSLFKQTIYQPTTDPPLRRRIRDVETKKKKRW